MRNWSEIHRDKSTAKMYQFGYMMGETLSIALAMQRVKDYSQDKLDLLSNTDIYGHLGYEYYAGYFSALMVNSYALPNKCDPDIGDLMNLFLTEQEYNFILFVLKDFEESGEADYSRQINVNDLIIHLEKQYVTAPTQAQYWERQERLSNEFWRT